ncbi:hypothetical protein WR25_00525 [Diploscapter pachys]|uniref:Uncharacterized protein n=1 Tax=Diploscapter pachys TaxID=2018661 RepID=A0A2A2KL53_9BILA|nr:hypothetical protein WR25_00525 [Diploscapter pachys]
MFAAQCQVERGNAVSTGAKLQQQGLSLRKRCLWLRLQCLYTCFAQQAAAQQHHHRLRGRTADGDTQVVSGAAAAEALIFHLHAAVSADGRCVTEWSVAKQTEQRQHHHQYQAPPPRTFEAPHALLHAHVFFYRIVPGQQFIIIHGPVPHACSPRNQRWVNTAPGSPANAQAKHNVPGGTPPCAEGPATPVVAMATVASLFFRAPIAISHATASLQGDHCAGRARFGSGQQQLVGLEVIQCFDYRVYGHHTSPLACFVVDAFAASLVQRGGPPVMTD